MIATRRGFIAALAALPFAPGARREPGSDAALMKRQLAKSLESLQRCLRSDVHDRGPCPGSHPYDKHGVPKRFGRGFMGGEVWIEGKRIAQWREVA